MSETINSRQKRAESIPYQVLASIYNQVMRHVNYHHWAGYIQNIIGKNLNEPVKMLDIGCGTGELIHQVGKFGYKADGCDPSEAMLAVARLKNPHRKFWTDRLPELGNTPSGKYNVMTSLYDTVNYLTSLDDIDKALDRIYRILPANSLFIFDLVSQTFCKLYFDNVRDEEVLDGQYAYKRNSYFVQESSEQINEFAIYTPDGIFEERHIQKIYGFEEIEKLIRQKTDFEIVGIYEDFTFYEADPKSNRAHFVLRKINHD
ncbi:MAG: methyltransferase domain-containing protein [Calditrichaeota bacterium]|nr:methyltransferase domain-containing protein [Calditrichota bacterium]